MLIFEGQQQNTSILIQTFVETFNKELEKLLFNSLFTGGGGRACWASSTFLLKIIFEDLNKKSRNTHVNSLVCK